MELKNPIIYLAVILLFIGITPVLANSLTARQELKDYNGFIVETDKKVYKGLHSAIMYMDITNPRPGSGKPDQASFSLFKSLEGPGVTIDKIEVMEAKTIQEPVFRDICRYVDTINGTVRKCKSVLDGYEDVTILVWDELPFNKIKGISQRNKFNKNWLEKTRKTGIPIGWKETKRFKVYLSFEPQTYGEFMLGVNDDKGNYGYLDPWFNSTYTYRRNLSCSNIDDGVPLVVNGSGGVIINGNKQLIHSYCSGTGTALYYNDETDYVIANDTARIPLEIEDGDGTNYLPTQVWDFYNKGNSENAVYTFKEGAGTDFNSSINSVNGTFRSDAGFMSGGVKIPPGSTYAGTDDRGQTDQTVAGWDKLTATFWYNTTPSGEVSMINEGDIGTSADVSLQVGFNTNNKWTARVFGGGGWSDDCRIYDTTPVQSGLHHVVYTWNGTVCTLYLDGNANETDTFSNTINSDPAGPDVALGSLYKSGSWDKEYDGELDHVILVNRSLTSSQVTQVYNAQLGTAGYGTVGAREELNSPPTITYETPTTASGTYSQDHININVSATDPDGGGNIDTIEVYLYNSTGLFNSQTSGTSPLYHNWTSLPDGTYYINATVNDTAGASDKTATRTITLDTNPPNASYYDPTTNGTTITDGDIYINVTASDTNLANITVYFYNETGGLIRDTTTVTSPNYDNITVTKSGTYYTNATIYDTAGNSLFLSTNTITANLWYNQSYDYRRRVNCTRSDQLVTFRGHNGIKFHDEPVYVQAYCNPDLFFYYSVDPTVSYDVAGELAQRDYFTFRGNGGRGNYQDAYAIYHLENGSDSYSNNDLYFNGSMDLTDDNVKAYFGNGYEFRNIGPDSYLDSRVSNLRDNNDWTVEGWFKIDDYETANTTGIFRNRGGGTTGWSLYFRQNGLDYEMTIYQDNLGEDWTGVYIEDVLGEWTHFLVTHNYTAGGPTETMDVYVNGEQVNTRTGDWNPNGYLEIVGGGYIFDGLVDEVYLWSKYTRADDVRERYNNSKPENGYGNLENQFNQDADRYGDIGVCILNEDNPENKLEDVDLIFSNETYDYFYYNMTNCTSQLIYSLKGTYQASFLHQDGFRRYFPTFNESFYNLTAYFPSSWLIYTLYSIDNTAVQNPLEDTVISLYKYYSGVKTLLAQDVSNEEGIFSLLARLGATYTVEMENVNCDDRTFTWSPLPNYLQPSKWAMPNCIGTANFTVPLTNVSYGIFYDPSDIYTSETEGTVTVLTNGSVTNTIFNWTVTNITDLNQTTQIQYINTTAHNQTFNFNITGGYRTDLSTCIYGIGSSKICVDKQYFYNQNYTGVGGFSAVEHDEEGGFSLFTFRIIFLFICMGVVGGIYKVVQNPLVVFVFIPLLGIGVVWEIIPLYIAVFLSFVSVSIYYLTRGADV